MAGERAASLSRVSDRYRDVLAPENRPKKTPPPKVPLAKDMVVEEGLTGFCGAVVLWENGIVVLEDRKLKRRSFPMGTGFLLEGKPVELVAPPRTAPPKATHTASGSRIGEVGPAKVAAPSRIYVEGRHDAELVEKVWGDDLRIEGVVVELLDGVDDLAAVIKHFAPDRDRRMGVLVDHLVPGTKEARIVEEARRVPGYSRFVKVLGHPYVDVWQSVRPERLGLQQWPVIPRGTSWKHGICAHLGWPHRSQADIARAWKQILGTVRTYADLEPTLLASVEELIDFVTVPLEDDQQEVVRA